MFKLMFRTKSVLDKKCFELVMPHRNLDQKFRPKIKILSISSLETGVTGGKTTGGKAESRLERGKALKTGKTRVIPRQGGRPWMALPKECITPNGGATFSIMTFGKMALSIPIKHNTAILNGA
jgi:hypothetical protein